MVDFTSYRKKPKTPWHNTKSMVGPDGGLIPAPVEEEKAAPVGPEPIGLPAYVKEGTTTADGWRRVVEHIRYVKTKTDNEDEIRTSTAKFVQDYPGSVRRVDSDYWTGMQLALDAYRSQDKAFWRSIE
jgi:hypothetical protein